jgi:hypothetical protein
MRKRISNLLLAALIAAAASPARATEFWTAEELERPWGPPVAPRLGYGAAADSYDADDVFRKACAFIEYWQVKDPNDPNYGGIREGEDLPNIIQTDNTSESVWAWSRWRELTGERRYDDAVARSWTYITKYPAWEEEGWGHPASKYYRYYNCGWGMRAEMQYRRTTGDDSYKNYALTCARFIVDNPIEYSYPLYLTNYLCVAWAAGNLYEYAVDVGDDDLKATAVALAENVKRIAEEQPAWAIGSYAWAMAGGATIWGLHYSYFQEHPGEEANWTAQYAPYLQKLVDPGSNTWDNAWNAWFMFGHHTAYYATNDGQYWTNFENVAANLVAQDTDGDGGIPPSQGLDDTHDHTWVTSYLCMMGMDRIIRGLRIANYAAQKGPGEIVVGWEPEFEHRAAGYNLYREEAGKTGRPKLNDDPLTGDPPYSFKDEHVLPGTTYRYWVEARGPGGRARVTGPLEVQAGGLPCSFALAQNYPNPCTGTTTVAFSLSAASTATLRLFDLAGREVYRSDGRYGVGKHELRLQLDLPPGVYLYRLTAGEEEAARAMVIVE